MHLWRNILPSGYNGSVVAMIFGNSAHPVLAVTAAVVHATLAVGCLLAWIRDKNSSRNSNLWISLMILQVVFAVDAFIGLRLLVADAGRQYFLAHGWYTGRRPLQATLTLIAFLLVVVLTGSGLFTIRRTSLAGRLAIAGSGILLVLFLTAAISLHEAESFALALFGRALGCSLTGAGIWLTIQGETSPGEQTHSF
jgi:hypothetical protein